MGAANVGIRFDMHNVRSNRAPGDFFGRMLPVVRVTWFDDKSQEAKK